MALLPVAIMLVKVSWWIPPPTVKSEKYTAPPKSAVLFSKSTFSNCTAKSLRPKEYKAPPEPVATLSTKLVFVIVMSIFPSLPPLMNKAAPELPVFASKSTSSK